MAILRLYFSEGIYDTFNKCLGLSIFLLFYDQQIREYLVFFFLFGELILDFLQYDGVTRVLIGIRLTLFRF